MQLVISQSMYFPWVGLLEQIKIADVFVHYDDVQFSRGFYNRVQISTSCGARWLTVPTRKHPRETNIDHVLVDDSYDWREQHRNALKEHYRHSPHFEDMIGVFDDAHSMPAANLSDVSRESIMALVKYFELNKHCRFVSSAPLDVHGRSSERLLAICRKLEATTYITGHGARNYLDHELFESNGVEVRYMNYKKMPYPQSRDEFTPFVSALDLIANCGRNGAKYICSETVSWKEFINGSR